MTLRSLRSSSRCRHEREHAVYDGRGKREYYTANHRHGGIESGIMGEKKCFTSTMSQLLINTWPE